MGAATHWVFTTQPPNLASGEGTSYPHVAAVLEARDGSNIRDWTLGQVIAAKIGVLSTGITSGALSLTLTAGGGAQYGPDLDKDHGFPAFYAQLYNATDYVTPDLDPAMETIRVVGKAGDVLTIERPWWGTTAVAHNTGGKTYKIQPVAGDGDQAKIATVSLVTITGAGVISGPTRIPIFNGRIVLRGLGVIGPGTYQYTIAGVGLTTATSSTFTVSAAVDTFYKGAALPRSEPTKAALIYDGAVLYVGSGDPYATVQAALNAYQPGDTIIVRDGYALSEAAVVPYRAATTNGVGMYRGLLIKRQTPPCASDTRCKPSDFASAGSWVAPIVNVPCLAFVNGANRVRVQGIKVDPPVGVHTTSGLINTGLMDITNTTGGVPTDIVLDRVCMVGQASYALNCRRGVWLGSANTALVNSHIENFHEDGSDSQAVWIFNTPGNLLIENCYLEAESENLMSGGADASSEAHVPFDITVRLNLIQKPLARKVGYWLHAKNLFELKNGHRVLVEKNILRGFWMDDQNTAVILKSVNQEYTNPFSGTSDVVFRRNLLHNVGQPFGVSGCPQGEVEVASRLVFAGNLAAGINSTNFNSDGYAFSLSLVADLVVDHNTTITTKDQPGRFIVWEGFSDRAKITNNLHVAGLPPNPPVSVSAGTATLNGILAFDPLATITKNWFAGTLSGDGTYYSTHAPAGNTFTDADGSSQPVDPGFVTFALRTTMESATTAQLFAAFALTGASALHNAGTDSLDIGVPDMATLAADLATVDAGGSTAGSADHLAISVQPAGAVSGVAITTQPVVLVEDPGNSTVTSDTSTVTATLNVTSGSGAITAGGTKVAVAGVAAFAGLTITGTGSGTITFSDGALTSVTSGTISWSAGVVTGPGWLLSRFNREQRTR